MKIGEIELEAGAPDAERLLASTGLSVAEMLQRLRSSVPAHLLARAIHACAAEAEGVAALARAIAAEGVETVRAQALKLYEEAMTLVLDAEAEVKKGAKRGGKQG